MKIDFTLNGEAAAVETEPTSRLLDILREDLGLKGPKEGCGEGECGACSVLLDGLLVNSCLIPMAQVEGAEVVTIDWLKSTEAGKLITESFAAAHSVQCGFCTPGMVMAVWSLLKQNPEPDEAEIRHGISGNICRCTGYDMIVDGVQLAVAEAKKRGGTVW
jgi:aerobic-type carbon monoxide dehydrogenase small subunit (CoxS/CutS family)